MRLDEFNYRRQIHDKFIIQILNAKKQILFDKKDILTTS